MHRIDPRTAYLTIVGTQGLARGLLIALLSFWVLQANLNPLQLVLLGTALEATLFVFQVPTGAFADAVGRRPAAVIGFGILGAGLGLQAFTADFGALVALQAISGVGWAFLIGALEAWVAARTGTAGLERVFLRAGQAQLLGLMGGMAMTVLAGQLGARVPIVAGGGLLIVAAVLSGLLMSEQPRPRTGVPRSRLHELTVVARSGLGLIRGSRVLFLLVVIALALGVSSEGWDRLYAAHLIRDLGLASAGHLSPVGWLATIGFVESLAGVIAFQLAHDRLDGRRPGAVLAAIYVARAVLMIGFTLLGSLPVAIVAYIGAETMRNLGGPLVDAWIARETPDEVRATVLSVVGQADSLGEIAAGPLVGLLGTLASLRAALALSAALVLPTSVLALAAERASAKPPVEVGL